MFIYARSEQCDLVAIYTITNTQRIRIYPGKIEIHPGQNFIACRTKKTKLFSRFLLLRIDQDSPVHTSENTERVLLCCKFTSVNAFTR